MSLPHLLSETSRHHFNFKGKGVRGFLFELVHRFNDDQCAIWAASLAYFALLSLVPLLVGAFALVGLLIHDPHQAALQVQDFVAKLLPLTNPTEAARKLIASAGVEQQAERLRQASGLAGIISLVTFLYTASRIFVNAAPALNIAFRAKETRNFWQINLSALGLLFATSILFLLSLLPASGIVLLRHISLFSGLPDPSPWWLDIILLLLGVLLNALIFTVIYRYLPSPTAGVNYRMAGVGGIVVAVLFEIIKQGFALYLRNFGGGNNYDKAYGSLGAVAIFLLWIHISSQLLLFGAEFARLYTDIADTKDEHDSQGKIPENPAGTMDVSDQSHVDRKNHDQRSP